MGWLRGVAVVLLAVALAGCVSNNFGTNADLSRVAERATPLTAGIYMSDGDEFGELTLDRDRTYLLTVRGDEGAQSIRVSLFGPVAGLYILQAEGLESGAGYQNIVAKVVDRGTLLLADDGPVALALSNLTASRNKPAQTPVLSGDAAENWATIEQLLTRYSNRFTWGLELRLKAE